MIEFSRLLCRVGADISRCYLPILMVNLAANR
jgi:hypothetical protein